MSAHQRPDRVKIRRCDLGPLLLVVAVIVIVGPTMSWLLILAPIGLWAQLAVAAGVPVALLLGTIAAASLEARADRRRQATRPAPSPALPPVEAQP